MEKRALVTYASKYGSTGGVADAIGKELCSKGVAVDIAPIKNAVNISSYQGVVVGSAVYMGKWMPEAVDFVKQNQDILCQAPLPTFLSVLPCASRRIKIRPKFCPTWTPYLRICRT